MRISQYLSDFRMAVRFKVLIYWLAITSLSTVYTAIGQQTSRPVCCGHAIFSCLLLALTFVGSLYVWRCTHDRDHPTTIKKRCASVFCAITWSSVFVYSSLPANLNVRSADDDVDFVSSSQQQEPRPLFWHLLGFKTEGLLSAALLPLVLTMILFIGPLLMMAQDGVFWHYLDRHYWVASFHNLVWLRNHLVAPFSEEFAFRACMLPLLTQCFGNWTSTLVCPLFFGVAHIHHLVDKLRVGCDIQRALLETLFQFAYTTVFGVYSAFLFLRTGHFVAPFVIHAFCNHMGFPNFGELLAYAQPKKSLIAAVFVIGLVSWIFLLMPLTEPHLYGNDLYWHSTS